jgi:hypothetical protein
VSTLLAVVIAVSLVLFGFGVHDLQVRLER